MVRTRLLLAIAIVAVLAPPAAGAPRGQNFNAHLSGAQHVPVRVTTATGQAILHLDAAATSVEYTVIVANVANVVSAHLHLGAPGTVGAVQVTLYGPVAAGGGPSDGPLVKKATFAVSAALLASMRAGQTYVDVHTDNNVVGTDTGPGDFASGEVRGQVRALGPKP